MQNFKSGYIEKRLSLTVLNAQKATFYAISEGLGIFSYLKHLSDLDRLRSVLGSFFVITQKHGIAAPKLKILSLTFSYLLTFDDIYLT